MQCFRHAPEPALGICRSCGRGVCAHCARDLGPPLACSEECERRVGRTEALIANGEVGYRLARRGSAVAVGFPLLLGAVLVYFGVAGERDWFNAVTAMGALLMLFGVAMWLRQRQVARQLR